MTYFMYTLKRVGQYIIYSELEFEPRTPNFFTFKMCDHQSLDYLTKKEKELEV